MKTTSISVTLSHGMHGQKSNPVSVREALELIAGSGHECCPVIEAFLQEFCHGAGMAVEQGRVDLERVAELLPRVISTREEGRERERVVAIAGRYLVDVLPRTLGAVGGFRGARARLLSADPSDAVSTNLDGILLSVRNELSILANEEVHDARLAGRSEKGCILTGPAYDAAGSILHFETAVSRLRRPSAAGDDERALLSIARNLGAAYAAAEAAVAHAGTPQRPLARTGLDAALELPQSVISPQP